MNQIETLTLSELSAKVPDEVWELIVHIEKTCGAYPIKVVSKDVYYGIEKIDDDRFLFVKQEQEEYNV